MGRKARAKKQARASRIDAATASVATNAGAQRQPTFPLLRMVVVFVAVVLSVHLVYWFLPAPMTLMPLQLFTARLVTDLVSATGIPVIQQGISLYLPTARWEVIAECTAYSAAIVFVAFVVAYPSRWRSKFWGVVLGLPFLFVANILRLVALAWVEKLIPGLAAAMHDYLWQIVFLLLLVVMWFAWIEWIVKRETHAALSD